METNHISYPGSGAREASSRRRKRVPIVAWTAAGALLLIIGLLACMDDRRLSAAGIESAGRPPDCFNPSWKRNPHVSVDKGTRPVVFPSEAEMVGIRAIILDVADRHDMDGALILAIVMAESGYDPLAVSERGARGLMQLMPRTAEALGVNDIFDPEENIDGGVRYFKALLSQFQGDITLALAAYNAGSRHVERYSGVPPFKATQRYIEAVLEHYRAFKRQLAGTPDQA